MTCRRPSPRRRLTTADVFPPRRLGPLPDILGAGHDARNSSKNLASGSALCMVFKDSTMEQDAGIPASPPVLVPCLKMSKFATLLALLSVVPSLAFAQSPVYGQCGGIGWSE